MAIESTSALCPGHQYSLTLTIGDHVETLDARVLWCRLHTTRKLPNREVEPIYRAAIRRIRPEVEPHPG